MKTANKYTTSGKGEEKSNFGLKQCNNLSSTYQAKTNKHKSDKKAATLRC